MNVKILSSTPDIENVVLLAIRRCYSDDSLDEITSINVELLDKVIQAGHLSVLEHASITFSVEGVSRVLLSQLTRHRLASYSVESQRYNDKKNNFDYVIPESIMNLNESYIELYRQHMEIINTFYKFWHDKIYFTFGDKEKANEDARYVFPQAITTKLVFTMNIRELLHFFELRLCKRAQWEIRELANKMLELCMKLAPAIFKHAGPKCKRNKCTEIKPCKKGDKNENNK